MFRSTEVKNVSVLADATNVSTPSPPDLKRRGFLIGVSAAGASAVAVTLKPAMTDAVMDAEPAQAKASGYHYTEHIQNYYRTAKV